MSDRARVPVLEMILLLLVALAVFYPVIARLLPSIPSGPAARSTLHVSRAEANVKVWVNLHSGVYYCHDSALYGKQKPGKFMAQPDAVQRGYSPADQKRCQ